MKKDVITAKVQRSNPRVNQSPSYKVYEVQSEESMSLLSLIKKIHDDIDRTLAYRNVSCYQGVCTACLMNIDGKNRRACSTFAKPGDTVTVGPAKKYPIIRDLVVDFGILREQTGFEVLEE